MAFPGWLAWTVQGPACPSVIKVPFVPPDVHTPGVVVENVTARPDDAAAVTVNGDSLCGLVRERRRT